MRHHNFVLITFVIGIHLRLCPQSAQQKQISHSGLAHLHSLHVCASEHVCVFSGGQMALLCGSRY